MEASEQMIRKNARMLDTTTKDSSKNLTLSQNEIDQFKQTQIELINSIEDTLRIQAISNEQKAKIETKSNTKD